MCVSDKGGKDTLVNVDMRYTEGWYVRKWQDTLVNVDMRHEISI